MTTQTLLKITNPDILGAAVHRFEITDVQIEERGLLQVKYYRLDSEDEEDIIFNALMLGVAMEHPDYERGYIWCMQYDKDGFPEDKMLHFLDYFNEVYNPGSEPYFTPEQIAEHKVTIEEVLLNMLHKMV